MALTTIFMLPIPKLLVLTSHLELQMFVLIFLWISHSYQNSTLPNIDIFIQTC